ncbi:MAG: type II CAAX endopeptidase family protein [Terriglobales bacterium]|jgi:membrane protease YdiL (CAAX protease family)
MSSSTSAIPSSKKGEPIAPWWNTALVLLVLFTGSAVSARQHTLEHVNLPGLSVRLSGYLTVIAEEWFAVLLVWLALKPRGLSIAGLIAGRWQGRREFRRDLGLGVSVIIVGIPLMAIMGRLIGAGSGPTDYLPKTPFEAIIWLLVAATAGFCEELIFRGYLTRQFTAWTGSVTLALLIQAVAFGLAHGYQFRSMIVIGVYGWLLGLLASWRKSLRPGMMAHTLQDSLGGLLAFFFLK